MGAGDTFCGAEAEAWPSADWPLLAIDDDGAAGALGSGVVVVLPAAAPLLATLLLLLVDAPAGGAAGGVPVAGAGVVLAAVLPGATPGAGAVLAALSVVAVPWGAALAVPSAADAGGVVLDEASAVVPAVPPGAVLAAVPVAGAVLDGVEAAEAVPSPFTSAARFFSVTLADSWLLSWLVTSASRVVSALSLRALACAVLT